MWTRDNGRGEKQTKNNNTERTLARVFLSYLHYRKAVKTSASSSRFILFNFLKKPKIKTCKDT